MDSEKLAQFHNRISMILTEFCKELNDDVPESVLDYASERTMDLLTELEDECKLED